MGKTKCTGPAKALPLSRVVILEYVFQVEGKGDSSWRCSAWDPEDASRQGWTQAAQARDLPSHLGSQNLECGPYTGCCVVVNLRPAGHELLRVDVICERRDSVGKTLDLRCLWRLCMLWVSIVGRCVFRLGSLP